MGLLKKLAGGANLGGYFRDKRQLKASRKAANAIERRAGIINTNPLNFKQAGAAIDNMKKGGVIKKTGTYKLHKGEKVIPVKK